MSRKKSKRTGSSPQRPPHVAPQSTPVQQPSGKTSQRTEDPVALTLSLANLLFGIAALMIYVATKGTYSAATGEPLIDNFKSYIPLVAIMLAFAKPALTSILGAPDASWSLARLRAFTATRTVLSIALLCVVSVVPLYTSGIFAFVSSFVHNTVPYIYEQSQTAIDRAVAFLTTGFIGIVFTVVLNVLCGLLANHLSGKWKSSRTRSQREN